MSLINQMLQDLDKRSASGAERGALPNQVRSLPRAEKSGMPWWSLGIAVAIAVASAMAWQFGHRLAPMSLPTLARAAQPALLPVASVPTAEVPPAPAPNLTEAVLTGPASRLALELAIVPSVDNRPAAPDAEPPAVAQKQPAAQPKLSKSTNIRDGAAMSTIAKRSLIMPLAADSVVTGEAAAAVAPVGATRSGQASKAPPVEPTVIAKSSTLSVKAFDPGAEANARTALANPQINKRLQQLTPQQLAENEYRDAANLLSQGRLAETQEAFQRALQLDPRHIGARQGLFGLLVEAKKNSEAEQVLQDGLKLNPSQPGFALALSGLQYQRGDTAVAIETLLRTAPAAQASPDYQARLAALLQRQSRHQEAVDYFQAALRLAPGSGVWLMGLGISQQALNRTGEAQDAFRRAKATNTLNPDLLAFVDQRLKQMQ